MPGRTSRLLVMLALPLMMTNIGDRTPGTPRWNLSQFSPLTDEPVQIAARDEQTQSCRWRGTCFR